MQAPTVGLLIIKPNTSLYPILQAGEIHADKIGGKAVLGSPINETFFSGVIEIANLITEHETWRATERPPPVQFPVPLNGVYWLDDTYWVVLGY